MSLRTNRLGEENYNKYGTLMKIIEYNRSDNIVVEFQDEYKKGGQSQYYPHASIDNRTAIDTFIRYLGRKKYSHQLHIDSIRNYLKRLYVR